MLYVGTCGFSYKDWIGPFYPAGTKAGAMLEAYAETFDAVEIDSSYYAIPKPSLFERMARRTRSDFRFTVKAPGSVTHLPAEAEPSRGDLEAFAACIAPLTAEGKLGAVLAQFPGAFKPGREALARLTLLRERWPEVRLVAEFRHRDWQAQEHLRALAALGIGWCNVDEPRLPGLMRPSTDATSAVGYVRFHGRNAEKWWKQERASAERYDYHYSDEQLAEWLPRIASIAAKTDETYVFFNNHRNGQAAANARQMAAMLGMRSALPSDPSLQLSLLPSSARSADAGPSD